MGLIRPDHGFVHQKERLENERKGRVFQQPYSLLVTVDLEVKLAPFQAIFAY